MNIFSVTVTVKTEDGRLFVKEGACIEILNEFSHINLLFVCFLSINAGKCKDNNSKNKQTTNSPNNNS